MVDISQLNTGQKRVYDAAIEWWKSGARVPFEISGPPGSGKSFLIDAIIDGIGIDRYRVAPMAYTGAAAINMKNHGMFNAKTVHSWLYKRIVTNVLDDNGNVVIDPVYNKPKTKVTFVEKEYIEGIDLFVIDEGGSIPPSMRNIIEKHRIPTLVAGDIDQLPPITGTSAYLNDSSKIHVLTEIMRQNQNSAIVNLCQYVKNYDTSKLHTGWYGDVYVIYEDQLTPEMIRQSDIMICSRNATREKWNRYVRSSLIRIAPNDLLPHYGEKLVCRRNNWNEEIEDGINLTNGLIGYVTNDDVFHTYSKKHGVFMIDFKPILSQYTFYDLICSYDYFTANTAKRKDLKDRPYALGDFFEFGYAITTHMSQGSEFSHGIYIEESMNPNIDYKLNYVGLSRFRDYCIFVKKRR